jgi:hypothetical protein
MPETIIPAVSVTTKNTVSLTLGIVAIVIGVIALLIGWVPFLGLFTIPAAIIGFLLAAVGVLVALLKKGKGAGLPVVGLLICIAALILPIISTGGASAAFSRAFDEARNKQTEKENASVIVVSTDSASTNHEVRPKPVRSLVTPNSSGKENDAPTVVWNSATNAIRIGDVLVQVKRLRVATVALQDLFGKPAESKSVLLAVTVAVTNVSAGKKLDYRTWRGMRFGIDDSTAKLTDDNDNNYKRINFSASTTVIGGVESESIYPGEGLTDVIVFEKPVEVAKWLHLALPAENIKAEGTIRFEIPDVMIERWRRSNDRDRIP